MSQVTKTQESPVGRERSREVKRATVLSVARSARTLSRVELSERTGLSAATLTPLVRELIAEGYLVEKGVAANRIGRPRSMLEFDPRVELVAAVSLGPDGLICQIADGYGELVASGRREFDGDAIEIIVEVVEDLVADHLVHLRGVAVAVPGISYKGKVRLAPDVGVVKKRSVGKKLSKRLGVPVVVDNDVNLMVAGEHSVGAGREVDNVMLFHFTDGVGAGLVLDGRVRRGSSGGAGEVGFFPTDGSTEEAGVGSFESRWSAKAIARVLTEMGHDQAEDSPVAALVAIAQREPELARYRDEVLAAWGNLIVSCICVVDPGLVLISGSVADLDPDSFAALEAIIQSGAPSPTDIRRGELGGDAVLHGAVSSALSAAGLLALPAS